MSQSISAVKAPIRSQFADDADFREILEAFVEAIPERCRLLAELHRSGSVEELGRQAHQLKGAGGGYGFSEISAAGAELQQACRAQDTVQVARCLSELLDLLGRIVV
ncbi:MAG TPA: Hpt domain-containing protein [Planctomycetaceae bacterium]|jgi:HPt (histidine-containing phosphotransfer) domain-containing protein|nr:Hpt domain-containing protein [Planctomycetaceae bacterium]